jgi:hypothetical protein
MVDIEIKGILEHLPHDNAFGFNNAKHRLTVSNKMDSCP